MSEPIQGANAEKALRHTQRARVRFGILGAARIAPIAMVKPAAEESEAEVTAVAAREIERARRFATNTESPPRTARTRSCSRTQASTLFT